MMVAVAMMFVTSFPLGMVLAFFFGAGFGTFTSVREDDICFRLEITFVCVYSTLTVCCAVLFPPSPPPRCRPQVDLAMAVDVLENKRLGKTSFFSPVACCQDGRCVFHLLFIKLTS